MGRSEPTLQASTARHREDLRLARAASLGDEAAATKIAQRLLPRVRSTVRYLAGDGPDGADLVQDVLVEILRSLGAFEGRSSLETWADRITVRVAMKRLRRDRKRLSLEVHDVDALQALGPGADRQAQTAIVQARLATLLGQLTEQRRVAFVLHVVHGYTAPEIARMTGSPVNTVRDRIKHARRKLRELVASDPVLVPLLGGEP